MARLTLDDVLIAMEAMGVTWEARENEITPYLESEGIGLFGLRISEPERLEQLAETRIEERALLLAASPPPLSIDWRNVHNQNWVTDIRHQKTCGSCVAFATCAVLESRTRIAISNANLPIDLSEAHLFFCGAGQACATGWNFDPALTFCRDEGVGQESDFPYTPMNQPCQDISPLVQVTSWSREATDIARKQAIAQNGPVIGGMRVFEDLYYYSGGVYRHVAGSFKGLHAVAVVGYDDSNQCWIVKNSWGENWGEKGFMRIGYGECSLDTNYPYYDPGVLYLGQT